jgi:hypothetical protein
MECFATCYADCFSSAGRRIPVCFCVCAGKSQDAAKAEYIALVEALAANDK